MKGHPFFVCTYKGAASRPLKCLLLIACRLKSSLQKFYGLLELAAHVQSLQRGVVLCMKVISTIELSFSVLAGNASENIDAMEWHSESTGTSNVTER